MQTRLLLGREVNQFGQIRQEEPLPGLACALSVGAQANGPSARFKGDARFPNEDGLLVAWEGERVLLAVADGHLGCQASHEVLTRAADWGCVPRNRGELALLSTGLTDPPWPGGSGTTLLVAVLDRSNGLGFALSWGDSTLSILSSDSVLLWVGGNEQFLRGSELCEPSLAEPITFELQLDDTLLLFTDGVNECNYRSPLSSVGPADLIACRSRAGGAPERLCREVAELALNGVRGFPGGEDNLALIVATRTS